ncbi:MAG TPA: hypothetical protein VE445_07400 [Nitrososphaeraceae archaeon]|jgi:hypothetical protein|nr:hypothetical protein [Nitrososphaeraceae archaeon]
MKVSTTQILSYNAKKALVKGIIIGIVTIIVYLAVVVITTPNLPAIAAINAAFKINSIVIFGLAAGIGVQVFISTYTKGLGCSLDKKKKGILSTGSGSTALSSFFSFFSLVPLGCCGSWLLVLSMLPSIFGSTLSVILIEYSKLLSYIGLAIVFGFAGLSALKLKRELDRRTDTKNNFNQLNSQETVKGHEYNEEEEARI